MTRHRALLARDPARVDRWRTLLAELPTVEVIGEAGDGHEALRLIGELHPDVVLMDIAMRGLDGIEATRRTEKLRPRPRILMLAAKPDIDQVRESLVAGADGYLVEGAARVEVERALEATGRGDVWVSPEAGRAIVDHVVRGWRCGALIDLTPRQREVLLLVAKGRTTREIASEFGLSIKTVESHRAQIMQRLEIYEPAGLVRYAIRTGIVSCDP